MHPHSALADHSSPRGSALPNIEREAPALTPTQIKVLRGVHSGLLNKQIAFELGIAESTVKAHMTALMRKLNVRNRTQVAMTAQLWVMDAKQAQTSQG